MTVESRLTKEVACLEVRNWNIGIIHDPSNSNVLGSGQDSVLVYVKSGEVRTLAWCPGLRLA